MKPSKIILLAISTLLVSAVVSWAVDAGIADYEDFEYPEPKLIEKPEDVGWFHTYIDLWWLAGMVAVGTLIFWSAKWIDGDAHKLAIEAVPWNLATIAVALAALAAFVLIPPFVSLPAALAAILAVMWRYVPTRNRRVLPTRRLFTPEHRKVLWRRWLGLFGVKSRAVERKMARVAKKYLPMTLFFQLGKVASPAEAPPDDRDPATGVKEVLSEAVKRHAREIYLVRGAAHLAVSFKIDGLVHSLAPMERLRGAALVQMVKHLADVDSADPHFGIHLPTLRKRYRIGVVVYGEGETEEVELFVRPEGEELRRLDALGLTGEQEGLLRQAADGGQGLVVVASPPEMGARTTLCAMLNSLDPFSRNIVTFERPMAGNLESIEQNDLTKTEGSLAEILKEQMQKDYDLMMLTEIPDKATALMALTAAERDQLFVARLAAPDAANVVGALVALGTSPAAVSRGLNMVAAQRLVRVLCPQCRMKVTPSAELLQKIGLDPSRVHFLWEESSGCEACGHTGFNGRTGIFEVWRIGEESRERIARGAGPSELHAAARKDGMKTLQQTGLRAVVEGTTSLKELARALKLGT